MTEKPKRQLILEAAFEVFSKKGFYGAKVDEIAEAAGIGKGTIYEYFKSKADVFHEMYIWYIEQYFAELEVGLLEESEPPLKLQRIVKNHVIFLNNVRKFSGQPIGESSSGIDLGAEFKNALINTYKEKLDRIKIIIEEGIEQGIFRQVDAALCTLFFFGGLGGISHAMFLFNLDISPDVIAEEAINLFLNGIGK